MADMPQGAPQPGGASTLVADIHSKMAELMDMLDSSGAGGEEDKQALSQIIQAYQTFVEQNLGSAPGQPPQGAPAPAGGVAPMEAGAKNVQPAM